MKNNIFDTKGLPSRFLVVEALHDNSIKKLPTERFGILAEKYGIPSQDRALGLDLLSGTIKRRRTIDFFLETLASRKAKSIQPLLLTILRLGIYQLVFEDRIPDFASIDTSCNLAKFYAGNKQVKFVNAVLRTIQRASPKADDISDDIAIAYSYPSWLVKRWSGKWDEDTLRGIFSAGNARPSMMLRANRIKLGDNPAKKLANILEQQECKISEIDDTMLRLTASPHLTSLKAFEDGLFQVQDITASLLVRNLKLEPEMKILDLCAGLGTKTTQIAEQTHDRAEIYAADRNSRKLGQLRENAKRLRIESIKTIPLPEIDSLKKYFDVIILDVPCSNSGVFDRRPEARWRIKESDFKKYAETSLDLLNLTDKLIKPTGQIGFSTCSIDDEENRTVLEDFCRKTSWQIEKDHLQLPTTTQTGGYWAKMTQ